MTLESARQLVTVNQPITLPNLEKVVPYTRARDIVLKNPDQIVVMTLPLQVGHAKIPASPLMSA